MERSREDQIFEQLYEELLKYNAALFELEKMSDNDLKYYYSTNLLQEEMKYLKRLIEEQYELSKNDNFDENDLYEKRINKQGEVITKELLEISKTDPNEIRKEITDELKKKYNRFNNVMVGLNVKDALDGVISIDDEIKCLNEEYKLTERTLDLFDAAEKSYNKCVDYSDNLELFQGTEAWKNVSECVDIINYYSEIIQKYNNKYAEFDYKYNNALECKKEYDNLKFYKKLTKKANKLRKEIKNIDYYNNVKEKYKNSIDYCLTKYCNAYDNVKNYRNDFNYYSEKLFNKTIKEDDDYSEVITSYFKDRDALELEYNLTKTELVKNTKLLFKDEKVIDRDKILNRLYNICDTRDILNTVSYSDRFFNNNPDVSKDKIRNILPDSEKVKMSEKDMKKMILKLNLDNK